MTGIEAQFGGLCSQCWDWFPPGTQIVSDGQGGWRHQNCQPKQERHGTVCPRCFTERSLAGTCGCDE